MKNSEKYNDLLSRYKLLSDLMDNVPDVIYFKDREGKLIMVNKAHAKGLGLKPEKVVGKTDYDFFPKERADLMTKDDRRVIKTGKPIIDKIERATRADGIDNYVSTTKIPRYDKRGNVIGLVGITRDITQRMQLEHIRQEKSQIEKKMEAMGELDKLRTEFVSIVSHELRTPLAVIKEAIMLIFDEIAGPVSDKQRGLLVRAKENVERLRHMIEDLLDISRIEKGILRLHYSLVNLNDLIKDSSDFFKKWAKEKGISLKYNLPQEQINIFLDAEKIVQVISNLVSNAIKFTDKNGEIRIDAEILEAKIRVCISDTGIGISKKDIPRLFNKFVQVSKTYDSSRRGVGLGLSIVRDLVEKHGGEVWVESELGIGSKFYFTLPRIYAVKVLDKHVINRINELLKKEINLYLINMSIIDFKEFKKKIVLFVSKKLFNDIDVLVESTFKEFMRQEGEYPQVVYRDYEGGTYSVIFPEADEKDADRLCELLKENLKKYFEKNKINNVFVNIGSMPQPNHNKPPSAKQLLANLYFKVIYIGSEVRRSKRISYGADIKVLLPKYKTEISQTLDISLDGVSFVSKIRMETDKIIKVRLRLLDGRYMPFKGRVAWIKNTDATPEKYKIGVEFIDVNEKDKETLSKFINLIAA